MAHLFGRPLQYSCLKLIKLVCDSSECPRLSSFFFVTSQDKAKANRGGLRVSEALLRDASAGEPKAP